MMAGIRSSDTKPEKLVRSALHRRGLRFARSSIGLPGRPDAVLPHWGVALFVNGCFWHMHGCKLSKAPGSNADFWSIKLKANHSRDQRNIVALIQSGWRVLNVWECALRGSEAMNQFDARMDAVTTWIREQRKKYVLCDVSGSKLTWRESIDEGN
jgi:DNA mismatch endonuclease (patch repair protein)